MFLIFYSLLFLPSHRFDFGNGFVSLCFCRSPFVSFACASLPFLCSLSLSCLCVPGCGVCEYVCMHACVRMHVWVCMRVVCGVVDLQTGVTALIWASVSLEFDVVRSEHCGAFCGVLRSISLSSLMGFFGYSLLFFSFFLSFRISRRSST